jgi:hypothetical protein
MEDEALSPDEVQRRMERGIRRALSTPPSPTRNLIGRTERAHAQRETRKARANRAKREDGEGA